MLNVSQEAPFSFSPQGDGWRVLPGMFLKLHSQLLFTALEEGGISALPGGFWDEVLAGERQFTVCSLKTKHGHGAGVQK